MTRREFITLLGGAAASWPYGARAQQEPSPIRPLIGLLVPLSATAATRNVAAFQSALRDDQVPPKPATKRVIASAPPASAPMAASPLADRCLA